MRKIRAIPTTFKNIQFRSRLEARWYAFFDLLAWNPQYEPFDLDSWIPDIVLPATHPVWSSPSLLVEVKPLDEPEMGRGWSSADLAPVQAKLDAAAPGSPVMVVGTRPFVHPSTGQIAYLGSGRAPKGLGPTDEDDEVAPDYHCPLWSPVSFLMFPRFPYGFALGMPPMPSELPSVERLWAEAGNLVQYKSPRR